MQRMRSNGAPSAGEDRRLRVLVVDDSEDTRSMYSEFFMDAGLCVASAADGEDALNQLSAVKPDLVVMDLAMPLMNGWDATRRIKSQPETKDIYVVVLTGHVTPENLRRAEQAGADAVLTKPCSPADLCALVRTILDR
jgi:CheY-like chemotaxis protein